MVNQRSKFFTFSLTKERTLYGPLTHVEFRTTCSSRAITFTTTAGHSCISTMLMSLPVALLCKLRDVASWNILCIASSNIFNDVAIYCHNWDSEWMEGLLKQKQQKEKQKKRRTNQPTPRKSIPQRRCMRTKREENTHTWHFLAICPTRSHALEYFLYRSSNFSADSPSFLFLFSVFPHSRTSAAVAPHNATRRSKLPGTSSYKQSRLQGFLSIEGPE